MTDKFDSLNKSNDKEEVSEEDFGKAVFGFFNKTSITSDEDYNNAIKKTGTKVHSDAVIEVSNPVRTQIRQSVADAFPILSYVGSYTLPNGTDVVQIPVEYLTNLEQNTKSTELGVGSYMDYSIGSKTAQLKEIDAWTRMSKKLLTFSRYDLIGMVKRNLSRALGAELAFNILGVKIDPNERYSRMTGKFKTVALEENSQENEIEGILPFFIKKQSNILTSKVKDEISMDDIFDAYYDLDDESRSNAVILMSKNSYKNLRLQRGADDHYIFPIGDLNSSSRATPNGIRIVDTSFLPPEYPVIIGNLAAGYTHLTSAQGNTFKLEEGRYPNSQGNASIKEPMLFYSSYHGGLITDPKMIRVIKNKEN